MFPVARGANGQPPIPPTDASKTVAPASSAAIAFAKPVLRVLWRWTPTGRPSGSDPLDEVAHLARHADADRVGEDDLVRARSREPRRERRDAAGVDGALERAAEGDADRHRRSDPVGVRALDDARAGGRRLLDRRACVAAVELVGRREGEMHLVEARVAQALVAALVERKPCVDDSVTALDPRPRPPRRRPSAGRARG